MTLQKDKIAFTDTGVECQSCGAEIDFCPCCGLDFHDGEDEEEDTGEIVGEPLPPGEGLPLSVRFAIGIAIGLAISWVVIKYHIW